MLCLDKEEIPHTTVQCCEHKENIWIDSCVFVSKKVFCKNSITEAAYSIIFFFISHLWSFTTLVSLLGGVFTYLFSFLMHFPKVSEVLSCQFLQHVGKIFKCTSEIASYYPAWWVSLWIWKLSNVSVFKLERKCTQNLAGEEITPI